MSENTYIVQAIVISGVVSWLVRRDPLILRLQVLVWGIFVSVIAWRFGLVEQQSFYSNDQHYWTSITESFLTLGIPWDVDVWFGTKIPYPVAALPLAMCGIHPTLSLKAVGLICLLSLSRRILFDAGIKTRTAQATALWLTACGVIGTFFSVLALRETMMMYFTYRFATDKSPAIRLVSLVALYILRPHLAAAIFVAEVMMLGWRWLRSKYEFGVAESPMLISLGVIVGTVLFSWGVGNGAPLRTPFNGDWGTAQTLRIASNFVGLQFLTVREETVNFPLTYLLVLRVFLNETVLIPTAFTTICLFAYRQLNDRDRFTLVAFTLYVTVVIGTDFNSFRQNLPLMPLMGLTLLRHLGSRHATLGRVSNLSIPPSSAMITPRET